MEKFNLHGDANRLTRGEVARYLPFDVDCPDASLATEISTFNDSVAEANQRSAALEAKVAEAVEAASHGGAPEALIEATNERRSHVLSDAQNLLRLWRLRIDLATRYSEAIRLAAEAAEADAKSLEAKVAVDLEAAGFTQGSIDPERIQFEKFIRRSHIDLREAIEEAINLTDHSRRVTSNHRESKDGSAQAERYLQAAVKRAATA